MKKIIYLVITVFISVSMYAQNQKWEVTIGTQYYDDYPNGIIELYDKGYYITAYTGSALGNGWNIKTDANGNVLYDKTLSHNDCNLSSRHVCSDSSGNIYTSGTVYVDNNTRWPFVIKTDSCGGEVWCKYFPGQGDEPTGGSRDIIINRDNEIVVLAFYWSNTLETFIIYLVGLDLDGNELWKHPYASKENYPLIENPLGYDLMEMNGEYFIAGDCYWPYPNNPNHVYLRPLFIGINSDFSEKFLLPYYALDSVYGDAWGLYPINDSTIMGIGSRWLDGFDMNTLIMFFNTQGEEIGYHQIPNIAVDSNAQYNLIKEVMPINDSLFLSPLHMGIDWEERFGELVYDLNGYIHNKSNRGHYTSNIKSTKTSNNEFVITVAVEESKSKSDILLYKIDENLDPVPFDTTLHVYDSLCPHTIQSGEMDLTNCLLIVGIDDWPTPDEYYESIRWIPIKAYPNPVKDGKLTLEFENTRHHQNMELRCYNDFGRQVHSQKIYKDQQDTDLNVSSWNAGIYVAVMYSNGGARGKVKFLIAK